MTPLLRHFRTEADIRLFDVSVTGTLAPILPADPMRYAVSVWNDATADLSLYFGASTPGTTGSIRVPPGSGPVFLTEDVIGELIRLPVSAIDAVGGTTTMTFTTVSYCSYRYEQMRRYVHARLSQLGAL